MAMNLPYTQIGGVRVGRNEWMALNASTPFGQITVDREGIEISVNLIWSKRYRLQSQHIQSIETHSGGFVRGIKIAHSAPGIPPLVVFWTVPASNLPILKSALAEAGYRVV